MKDGLLARCLSNAADTVGAFAVGTIAVAVGALTVRRLHIADCSLGKNKDFIHDFYLLSSEIVPDLEP